MIFMLDLTTRQASRVLEQALRTHASVLIEPRSTRADPFAARFTQREGNLLHLEVDPSAPPPAPATLIGVFCDARTVLSDQLYLFSTYIVDVLDGATPTVVLIAAPELIQLANRRKFERLGTAEPAQVRVWHAAQVEPIIGVLSNVGVGGLACLLPGQENDAQFCLDDEVRVSFELPGDEPPFDLPAIVCNKTAATENTPFVLGIQFVLPPDDPNAQHTLDRLRALLNEWIIDPTRMDGDA
jgi:hypothetical protein